MEQQKMNTTVVYILAILGFLCCCFAGLGFVPAAIAFFIANGKVKEWRANPDQYVNGNAMKTAKTVALVSLIINLLYLAVSVYRIYSMGGWDAYMEESRQIMEQYGM